MSDARAELSPEKRAELDKLALELVRGSVVEFAAARFIAMIVAEAHSHSAAELTRLRDAREADKALWREVEEVLKECRRQLEEYEQDATNESYNYPPLNVLLAKIEGRKG